MNRVVSMLLAFGAAIAVTGTAQAEVAQLRVLNFASEDTPYVRAVHQLVDYINREGEGLVQITSTVGPEAIPVNQMGNALKNGIVDILCAPGSYLSNLQPGMQGLSATTVSPQQQRENGALDLVNEQIATTVNARLLGQTGWGTQFNYFFNRPVKTLEDFKGKRIRTSNTYRSFVEALGAEPLNVPRSEIYTGMERRVIDGYINVNFEIIPAGWAEVTSSVTQPPFYNGMIEFLINKDVWDQLNEEQQAFLTQAGLVFETSIAEELAQHSQAADEALKEAGIEFNELSPEEAREFTRMSLDATWNEIEELSPDFGSKLRSLVAIIN